MTFYYYKHLSMITAVIIAPRGNSNTLVILMTIIIMLFINGITNFISCQVQDYASALEYAKEALKTG